ncbi:MAG: ribosomal RNA small subunit methyltransferase A [Flavobacteriales bacterium]|nr:ribosomal RNA small subunit methyltransferase A [Flavobacteriales bacterium]
MKNIKAKKRYGQHFLTDANLSKKITDLLDLNLTKNIIEVGPGMGALTYHLLEKNINLKVVEIDNEAVTYLLKRYPNIEKSIIHENFLNLDLQNYGVKKFSIIGNFPYNISSQILFKAYDNKEKVIQLVGMFQKEVADRICATKGRKKGILSILLQTFYDIEYCYTIHEDMFRPQPKVKSGVVKMKRNNRTLLECNESIYKMIVKTGYNQRRKTLKNALKSVSLKKNKKINNLLKLRAEELNVEDFITLALHATT